MGLTSESDFTSLYLEQYDDLLRFVRRRAHPSTVDDIVGETFLTAWRRRAELPDDARPWLFGAARHLMLNSARGQNRQDALAVKIGTVGTVGPDATGFGDMPHSSIDDRIDLQAAWRALPAAEQEILALSVWEELPQAQAAAVIGCSRAAYSMRLTRAKRHLAELLDVPAPAYATASTERNHS